MLELHPDRVYVTHDVYDDPQAAARADRMIAAMHPGGVERVGDAELDRLAQERGWDCDKRWGQRTDPRDPDIVLTTGKFHDEAARKARLERHPGLAVSDLGAYRTFWFRPDGEPEWRKEHMETICQSAYQFHTITGCPFRCAYCWLGHVNRVIVDIERYMEHMDDWLAQAGKQRLFKWDNVSDIPCFEPEYDASRLLVDYFARKEAKFLEIYVGKSDNTDYLLDYDHRGHTILQWSLSPKTQAELLEPRTAPWDARIDAARRCQQAGYIVRFRFSPIVPIRNWREEYAQLIERIFARTQPDVISLCALGWMRYEDVASCIDMELLDPQIVETMKATAPFLDTLGYTSGGGRPIPHDVREVMLRFLIGEIRKHSADTTIALCLETDAMWTRLGPLIGQKQGHYVCNCGPNSTPGDPLYERTVNAKE